MARPALERPSATNAVSKVIKKKQERSDGEARGRRRAAPDEGLDKRELLKVLTAFRQGVFTVRMPRDLAGIDGKIADALNGLLELNARLAHELARLSRVVGEEGRISQRAFLGAVGGAWAESVDSVNSLIVNLVHPTSETARVLGAVARGDPSQTMALEFDGRPLRGEFLTNAKTVNAMVAQLSTFASEVTRVAREVGTEGKLGGQARVRGAAGIWKDLTDSVNLMAGNLTAQVRNINEVTKAVASGDLSKKITVDVRGEILELKNTLNTMVDQLNSFASEVTRVAREVGTEGKLGGQASVKGAAGIWKDLTDSVNLMAGNLTAQVRNIADVATAVATGDLSRKITVDVKGEILQLKNTLNTMVDQLNSFASEVTRVAREVGTEGKLGGQADVQGVAGVWKDLTDNVNLMAGNLTAQVRNIADVATAVATGDLSRKITVDVKGEILQLKNTLNTMVDQLNSFASEVTRVAREVGTEGKLGGQADVQGVAGVWKDLTDNVNLMAGNLTAQVRNIADVATAVATGDLSRKITVDVKGEILQLKNTLNTMVDQLNSFASEVTRVAREVGTDGKLGGQADVRGVAGVWRDLTESVNLMAGNLTAQVRNIADVTKAVAMGDLSRKITVDVKGEILELKNTLNTMVDQLNSFASEVTRVAREVGTDGKLGGQADVQGVAGVWRDLTEKVNLMAGNLTAQVRNIADVATAVATGDLSRKITVDVKGEILELKNTLNTMVDQLNSFASEVTRVAREVGTEGKLGGQADVKGVAGVWKDLTDNVNLMAGNLTAQVRNIAAVTTAVATGDLSRKITVDVKGEILELKNTLNTMVDQLNSFASEVTRVAREVGTDGKLGGQADVKGVAGVWKDLTDNVNSMASNLTDQVRGIARVVTAVAHGDLTRELTVETKGEIAALADTINGMIETLAIFADQVTTVAREVGVEGKLGGQAHVPGAAGTWKDLTDNVNQLAANLTTQMRTIAEVATAVTTGDLTRSITVEASGEVAALKDTINEMISHLRDTTQKNTDQDWLKTNLAKFSRMLQGQRDLLTVGRLILSELAPVVYAQHGVFYILESSGADPELRLLASYAHRDRERVTDCFRLGEGLVGQGALEKSKIVIKDAPPDYIRISSGLGEAEPVNVIVLPVLFEGQVKAVLELASFQAFNPTQHAFLDQLAETIGIVLNTIEANLRTEDLLKQSQSLATELQNQQEELRQTNQQLQEKAQLLAEQNAEVERKNREIDKARLALEEKATQLAVTSKYKSEFMANMSHELRTPLNSLLILSDELSRNSEENLSTRQMEFVKTIHASGTDLLTLINDILDLAKIESGTVTLEVTDVRFADVELFVDRTFRHVAASKDLRFELDFSPELPRLLQTDAKRLQQVVKNLLSNAFKFTERGGVTLSVQPVREGWNESRESLNRAEAVIAFSVSDTGIGIPAEKHQIIFEAFQQADGSTNRRYGGTGLGLNISREIATLLAGELRVESALGEGSTFTLYLPLSHPGGRSLPRELTPNVLPLLAAVSRPQPSSEAEEDIPLDRVADDRGELSDEGRVLLIVENDDAFARFVLEVARQRGWQGVVASSGASALALAREIGPHAITLDMRLPDVDGWRLLRLFKADLTTRHIPVLVVSTDDEAEQACSLGAIGVLAKPVARRERLEERLVELAPSVDRREREVLITAAEDTQAALGTQLAEDGELRVTCVAGLAEALSLVEQTRFDCVIVQPLAGEDPALLDELEHRLLAQEPARRLVRYAPDASPAELRERPGGLAATSLDEVLDAALLLLHRRADALPPALRSVVDNVRRRRRVLHGRRVLIVDDDIRNIFALTSVLEKHEMEVLAAESGQKAIEMLEANPGVELVLMDVMMPGMDGFETMRELRKRPQFRTLPIVAVTARAMKGDREKTLRAGAWDYLAKPVEPERMLAVLEAWLHR